MVRRKIERRIFMSYKPGLFCAFSLSKRRIIINDCYSIVAFFPYYFVAFDLACIDPVHNFVVVLLVNLYIFWDIRDIAHSAFRAFHSLSCRQLLLSTNPSVCRRLMTLIIDNLIKGNRKNIESALIGGQLNAMVRHFI